MVDGQIHWSEEDLLETAAKLRLLARRTQSPEARSGLIELAERFEREASRIGKQDTTSGGRSIPR